VHEQRQNGAKRAEADSTQEQHGDHQIGDGTPAPDRTEGDFPSDSLRLLREAGPDCGGQTVEEGHESVDGPT